MNKEIENRSDLVKEVYELVDPRANTNLEKSRTAFLSIHIQNGSIAISAFLARAMGFVAGDRIALISSKQNKLKWFICKTNQRNGTREVRINRGVYKVNDLKWARDLAEAWKFNPKFTRLVRLYVNMQTPIKFEGIGEGLQLYDLPHMREDFETPEEKMEYIKFMEENPYIIKPLDK